MEIRTDPAGFERWFVAAAEFDAEFELYGSCPAQAFGTVLGREFYFRARGESWSFEVADSKGRLPSDGYRDLDGYYREAEYPLADWMPLREVIKRITTCLEQYTGSVVRRDVGWPDAKPPDVR